MCIFSVTFQILEFAMQCKDAERWNALLTHSYIITDPIIKLRVQIVAGLFFKRACTTVNISWGVKYLSLQQFIIFRIPKKK